MQNKITSIVEAGAYALASSRAALERTVAAGGEGEPVERFVDLSALNLAHARRRQEWSERLAQSLARAHACRLLILRDTTNVYFVGAEAQANAAAEAFAELVWAAIKLADKAHTRERARLKREGEYTPDALKGYGEVYRAGFVKQVATVLGYAVHTAMEDSERAPAITRADQIACEFIRAGSEKLLDGVNTNEY